jgi:hypothetical protein
MTPEQRAHLRERYERFAALPPEQQQSIRAAFRRFGGLPPEERERLRQQFEQMSPEQRQAFLDGAQAQNRAAMIREFNQSMPADQRQATHAMLRTLSFEQRRAFHRQWRSLPAEQRDAYRRHILDLSPEQRSAELNAAAASLPAVDPAPH